MEQPEFRIGRYTIEEVYPPGQKNMPSVWVLKSDDRVIGSIITGTAAVYTCHALYLADAYAGGLAGDVEPGQAETALAALKKFLSSIP